MSQEANIIKKIKEIALTKIRVFQTGKNRKKDRSV